jgi:hypothetical protein
VFTAITRLVYLQCKFAADLVFSKYCRVSYSLVSAVALLLRPGEHVSNAVLLFPLLLLLLLQVFFSIRNPLLRWKLPFIHKLLYNNGTW